MNLTLPDLIVTTEDLTVDPAECLRLAEDVHVLQMRVDACEYEQGKPSYTCEAVVQLGHLARTALPALARRTLVAERFKTWVHAFLDEQGIPADPDPEEAKRTG